MQYTTEEKRERVMRGLRTAASSLRYTLVEARKEYPDLPKMRICVDEETDTPSTLASRVTFVIIGDTQEHAEEHANVLADQGCACQSTGETEVTCECVDIE